MFYKKSRKIISLVLIIMVLLNCITIFADDTFTLDQPIVDGVQRVNPYNYLVENDGIQLYAALPSSEVNDIFNWFCDMITYNYVYKVNYIDIYKSVVEKCKLQTPSSDTEYAYKQVIHKALSENNDRLEEFVIASFGPLDDYSNYYTQEQTEQILSILGSSNIGMGISMVLAQQGVVIAEVISDSPAAKSGIQTGDVIVAINGNNVESVDDMDLISEKLAGDNNAQINLTIRRVGEKDLLDYVITKGEFENTSVYYRFIGDTIYILFDQFVFDSAKQIQRAIDQANERGIKKVIIDVRGNGGGSVNECREISEIFLPKGKKIVDIRYKISEYNQSYTSRSIFNKKKYELVLLTDKNSASASEMLALALRENNVCTVIGDNTYGKRVMQYFISCAEYPNIAKHLKGAFGISVAEILGPSGNPVPEGGFVPDIKASAYIKKVKDNTDIELITDFTPLAPLTSNDKVMGIKKRLSLNGYYIKDVYSPMYDAMTVDAIKLFQKNNNLVPNGYIDYATQIELINRTDEVDSVYDEPLNKALKFLNEK